ncbi:hypothetical protein [Comamonas serinivorans]|uniref:hypothetical protein n=1 Tax=Comamonas serinivorans TaxID=1082851 RepID=UPI0012FCD10D|nr:hypothetical protein [Comamonas serinivorans]
MDAMGMVLMSFMRNRQAMNTAQKTIHRRRHSAAHRLSANTADAEVLRGLAPRLVAMLRWAETSSPGFTARTRATRAGPAWRSAPITCWACRTTRATRRLGG